MLSLLLLSKKLARLIKVRFDQFRKISLVVFVTIGLLTFSSTVHAANFTWVGTLGSDWDNALNWNNTLAGYPNDPSDNITINNNGILGSCVLDANRSIGTITITGGSLNLGGFTLASAGNLSATGGTITNGRLVATGVAASTATIQNLTTTAARLTLTYGSFVNISSNTIQDSIVFNKIGIANNTTNNSNTFTGITTISHTGASGNFRFSSTAANTFAKLIIQNNSATAVELSYAFASTFNGDIILNGTGTGGISFGAAGGASALASGRNISSGTFTNGNLNVTSFTQSGTSANSITLGSGNATFTTSDFGGNMSLTTATSASATFTSSNFRGAFTLNTGSFSFVSSTFNQTSGTSTITKSGNTVSDNTNNGNTFWGVTSIIHNGGAQSIRFSGTTANTFKNDLTLTNNNSGAFQMSYAANNIYEGNITLNTSTTGISFGDNAGTSTQSASKAVSTGTHSGGNTSFNNFTQNGNASSVLNLAGGNLTITNSSFGGNMGITLSNSGTTTISNSVFLLTFTLSSGGISLNNNTYNQNGGTTSITTTGSALDSPNNDLNTFYGITSIRNNTGSATRVLYFASTVGDTYYSNATFDNSGTSPLSPVRNGNSIFHGNIIVNNSTVGIPITFNDGGGSTTISGTSMNQIMSNNGIGPVFVNLTINKASNGIVLNVNTTISTAITLTNGYLNLNSNELLVNNSAAAAISRTNGYVLSGTTNSTCKISWNVGSTTGSRTFPFGKSDGTYIPFMFNLLSGTPNIVSVYTYSTAADNTPYASPVSHMGSWMYGGDASTEHVIDRFWKVYKSGASGTAAHTFTYADNEIPLSGEASLFAQVWTSDWQPGVGAGDPSTNTVTATGITDFSHWTIVNVDYWLPVNLLRFQLEQEETENKLHWETAANNNIKQYTLQKSSNGTQFEEVNTVPKNGSSIYSSSDKDPYEGSTYYRLQITHNDGRIEFSNVLKSTSTGNHFQLYPVPSEGNELYVHWESKEEQVLIVMQDVLGKTLYEKVVVDINLNGDINLLTGHQNLEPGIYMVIASSHNELIQRKIIIR